MEMRKTSVWVSRSLGLLFVFSSFGHLAEANSSKSQVVQKKINNSQVSGSTGRMATIGRFCKKHWYLAIPAMGAAGYVAYRLKNNSAVQKNESNSVVRKPKAEQSGAAQRSVDAQEKTQPQELTVCEDSVKESDRSKPVISKNNIRKWANNIGETINNMVDRTPVGKWLDYMVERTPEWMGRPEGLSIPISLSLLAAFLYHRS